MGGGRLFGSHNNSKLRSAFGLLRPSCRLHHADSNGGHLGTLYLLALRAEVDPFFLLYLVRLRAWAEIAALLCTYDSFLFLYYIMPKLNLQTAYNAY